MATRVQPLEVGHAVAYVHSDGSVLKADIVNKGHGGRLDLSVEHKDGSRELVRGVEQSADGGNTTCRAWSQDDDKNTKDAHKKSDD